MITCEIKPQLRMEKICAKFKIIYLNCLIETNQIEIRHTSTSNISQKIRITKCKKSLQIDQGTSSYIHIYS